MPELPLPRRIVTAHKGPTRGFVAYDGPPPASRSVPEGSVFHEMWLTATTPVPIAAAEPEPVQGRELLGPPRGGTRVRIVDIPAGVCSPMHRTESVDYGVVLAGQLTLVLDEDQSVEVRTGDVVVQRGTDHAWENRGESAARVLFVLVDGRFDAELRAALPADAITRDM